jgi:2-polyprenyl-3-methyl-5-hydroxy-6-metoxy-1,4-benzoquinol methylase
MINEPQSAAKSVGNRNELYHGYETWKGWDETFVCSVEQARYYVGECRDLKIAGADILEIGFGSGTFLAWASERGAREAGSEINPALLKAAEEFGVDIFPAAFETVAQDHADRFDTIAAFDVFEHFSLDEIIARLQAIETMLRPGGHLLLRFPNGQSPFGLAQQNGDPTHKTALSRSVFEQLIQSSQLEITRYGPAYRITGGGFARGFARRLRYLGRNIIAGLLNFIYAQQIPWDPVVVLVLRKASKE